METDDNLKQGLEQQKPQQSAEAPKIPDRLIDQTFSFMIFKKPVVASDGHTYEEEEIEDWFKLGNNTSPKTGDVLNNKNLTTNWDKINDVNEFLQEHPECYGEVYLPRSWITKIILEIKNPRINKVRDWLGKDPRLLTMPLEGGYTSFHLAVQFGSLELADLILKQLIEKKKFDAITTINQPANFKPAHLNALLLKEEDKKIITLLLKLVPDINAVDSKTGNTLLHDATKDKRWLLALQLLKMGASTYIENDNANDMKKEKEEKEKEKEKEIKLPQFEQFKEEKNPQESITDNLNLVIQKKNNCLCMEPLPRDRVAIGLTDGTIEILDQKTAELLIIPESLTGHSGPVTCLIYLQNNAVLVSGSSDNTVRIWGLNTNGYECKKTLTQHTGPVIYLKCVFDEYFVSCSADNTMIIWNTNGERIQTLGGKNGHTDAILRVEQVSNFLISCSVDKTLKIWNRQGECVQTLGGENGHTGAVSCVVEVNNNNNNNHYNNNDLIVASGSTDSTIKLWNTHSGTCITTLKGHTESVNCLLLWSPNTLITGSADKTIRVWNITTSHCTYILSGHNGPILSLQRLASGELMSNDEFGVKTWSGPDFKEQMSPKKLSNQ